MNSTVLIVDDSPTVRRFVHAALDLEGFAVVEAANGMEALELLPSTAVDLVLTDLNMPDMDGLEFLKTLRESEMYRQIPVIVLSSMAEAEMRDRAQRLGASAYLAKPFSREALTATISRLAVATAQGGSEIS